MKRVLVSVLGLSALAAASAQSSSGNAFYWPDSSQYSRVIVNATQGIETRPREWFAKDKLVTDFRVANVDKTGRDTAAQEYQTTRQLLISYGLTVGTYVSGTAVVPEPKETYWPSATVALESMPSTARYSGTWPDVPYRHLIDVTDPATRHALQTGIKRLWEQSPAPVRFIDNAAAHHAVGGLQPWASYCANMEEIRKLGESMGSLQIFNIAVHVEDLSDEETRQLIQAVGSDGIALEMPWPKNIRDNPAKAERAKHRYRQLLDTGMGIIMVPAGAAPPQELVDWVRTWRKPTDHLYFNGAFFKAPDPKLFGPGGSS